MKNTAIKSIVTLAMVALVLTFGSSAVAADTVNCGVVELNRADYEDIQARVAGTTPTATVYARVRKSPAVDCGGFELSQSEYTAIRNIMVGKTTPDGARRLTASAPTVNAGLVEMGLADFEDLKRLVSGQGNLTFGSWSARN